MLYTEVYKGGQIIYSGQVRAGSYTIHDGVPVAAGDVVSLNWSKRGRLARLCDRIFKLRSPNG